MGGRVGWPVVVVAALTGAIVGALLTWATLSTSGVVQGADPTPASSGAPAMGAGPGGPVASIGTGHRRNAAATASAVQLEATYDFDIRLDFAAGRLDVVEVLTVTNHGRAADAVQLLVLPHLDADGFRELTLRHVEVGGRRASARWTERGSNLVVGLAPRLAWGSTATLRLDFQVMPGNDAGSVQPASTSKAEGLMQLLLWYPMLSDGHAIVADGDPVAALPVSEFRFAIHSVSPIDLAVPGEVERRTATEVVGRLHRARDFAFAASPSFRTWEGRSGATSVTVYALPGDDGAAARDAAVRALNRYHRILDAPYPARRYVLVGGTMDMESSGIAFVHREDLLNPYLVAHETAHQWFPWLVGSDQVREPWLDESLATFLAMDLQPRHETWCSGLPVDLPVDAFPNVALETGWADCDGYIQTVYWKGSAMWAALDRAMGRKALVAALRDYVAAFRFRIATEQDLLTILRRHAAGSVDAVLDAWLRPTPSRSPDRGMGPLA